MLIAVFLINLNDLLLLGAPSESVALLMFGIGLIGATAMLRRILKRRDERIEEEN